MNQKWSPDIFFWAHIQHEVLPLNKSLNQFGPKAPLLYFLGQKSNARYIYCQLMCTGYTGVVSRMFSVSIALQERQHKSLNTNV